MQKSSGTPCALSSENRGSAPGATSPYGIQAHQRGASEPMCGIVGIVGTSPVNQRLYDALTVLQHRGQDAAGIVTSTGGELYAHKGRGLVRDVFQQHHMLEL